MYTTTITTEGAQARVDICKKLNTVTIESNKLIVKTSYGTTLDIAKPEHELSNKINICFSTINKLLADSQDITNKTIKVYYNVDGGSYSCYISDNAPATE